jgi:glutamyl-tRNA reductase
MKKNNHIITVIGINHHTARIEDRELLEIDKKEIKEALLKIFANPAVESVLILNTCNRLEFYILVAGDEEPFDVIKAFYKEARSIEVENKRDVFYIYKGVEATRHLFRVISGLDSLVVGEYQIQGQVRDAYSLACDVKTMENVMHKLFHAAFRCGKAVRSKTSLGEGRQSVSGVAAGLFFEYCDIKDNIVIIGVNENTRIIARELKAAGYNNLIFINRTLYKAEIMAEEFEGEAYPFDKLMYILSNADAVFSSTGAPHYIVNSKMLQSLAKRNIGPELIIDMAVPRDFNTEGLPSRIKTFDISDLKEYLSKQSEKKAKDLPKAEKIIEDEVKVFSAWTEFSGSDLLKPFAEKFEITRLQILDEFRSQFSAKDFELVDKLSRRMLHRVQATFVNALKKKNQEKM